MRTDCIQMIETANKALIVEGKLDEVVDFFDSGYTVHMAGRDFKGGQKIVRDFIGELRKSFTDIQVDTEVLVVADDKVAWLRTFRGNHEGTFKDFAASGLKIEWRDMVTSRFHKGKIVEEWIVTDLAEQLLQSRKRIQ